MSVKSDPAAARAAGPGAPADDLAASGEPDRSGGSTGDPTPLAGVLGDLTDAPLGGLDDAPLGGLDDAPLSGPGSAAGGPDGLELRVRGAAGGIAALLAEAQAARIARDEASGGEGASAVCAWNHFENIPTFYNWNNRPR
jgi:hypothetical protein